MSDWRELNKLYPDSAVAVGRYPYATCCICHAGDPCEESTGWRNRPCRACWETVLGQPGVEPGGVVFEALRGRR